MHEIQQKLNENHRLVENLHDVDASRVSSCSNSTVMDTDIVEMPRTASWTKTYFIVLILLSNCLNIT